ncbi:sulfate adenylyltransferase subunit CysN [Buchnera aphidicola (Mollitrichosiphum nigrofasciatum)]|uniref:sulfate adenylyltransferase subunit CysN n=1 Tax=Buchnera aphidicola TaxID=9 RepID=UPI0031B82AFA
MNIVNKNIKKNNSFKNWFEMEKKKNLLRFLTCGSVDDGKSTLIGRLLHDTKMIYSDQLISLKNDSKRHGTQGSKIDLSLLLDSLQSEKEQGITIDVAYRYFSTNKKKFIIVDTPGHIQYTRNMATGASNCDLAILLIDASKGLLEQTKRHSFIVNLLGIKNFIIAINKMDVINYSKEVFLRIKNDFLIFSKKLSLKLNTEFIPISALSGENVVYSTNLMPWYEGLTLLRYIESINLPSYFKKNTRFPIQYINRPNSNFRGYSGTLVSGSINVGQKIKILPSFHSSYVKEIITFDGKLNQAVSGQAITILLKDEIDISRGDCIVEYEAKVKTYDEAIVDLVWMDEEKLILGKSYNIKIAGKKIKACVKEIIYKININNLNKEKQDFLCLNDIGLIHIIFEEKIFFEKYIKNNILGGMIFIDILNNRTLAAGMIRKSKNNTFNSKKIVNKVFELELNTFICKYFPHWKMNNLLQDWKKK